MKTLYDILALVWRVPGFILSFLFYRGTRKLILSTAKVMIKKRIEKGEPLDWIAYSESLQIPGALPYMMCTTSRWNPHAPLGALGPFKAESHVDIQIDAAKKSARGWIITIFHGDFEVVHILYPGNTQGDESWKRVKLKPDTYQILVRYYGHSGDTVFPGIKIDGKPACKERNVGNEMQKSLDFFANNVVDRRGLFYYGTQYYIYQLLRWKDVLSAKRVRRIYLPVGDPQITSYEYGILKKGERLHLQYDKELLDVADVYVTYCNRCGFPAFWDNVTQANFTSRPSPYGVVYLVRVVNYENEEELDLKDYQFNCEVLEKSSDPSVFPLKEEIS